MPAEDDAPALFLPDGDRLLPTVAARGPWTPEALHGGPPAALLCREIERLTDPAASAVVRLTVELLKPVPVQPLSVRARLVRPGRRAQWAEAVLMTGETELAWARALLVRSAEFEAPSEARPLDGALASPPPVAESMTEFTDDRYAWLNTVGVEVRFIDGAFMTPGPCRAWFRLRVPVVAGEDPTPAQFAMVVADSGNGAGSALQFGRYGFVNPELSVHLARQPRGEWLCLDAGTVLGDAGAAVADSRLWDGGGLVGTSTQGLLVEQV